MNFTLISQEKVLTISRIDDSHVTICCNYEVRHLYVKWWILGKKNRERYMTRQVRQIVGQLIEDGWDCQYIG